jgi:hypothetical protein
MSRISLNEGGTKRRVEMARFESWYWNASSSANGVKKLDMVGTSIANFEYGLPLC